MFEDLISGLSISFFDALGLGLFVAGMGAWYRATTISNNLQKETTTEVQLLLANERKVFAQREADLLARFYSRETELMARISELEHQVQTMTNTMFGAAQSRLNIADYVATGEVPDSEGD